MALPVQIQSGCADSRLARVTDNGALVVAASDYDEAEFKELAANDTAYNFYKPKDGEQFVITGVRAKADRDVSNTTDATVVIYEASDETSTTVDKTLYQEAMVRGENFTITGVNIIVTKGKYVNAKTTDDDIHMTIFGYYISREG